MEFPRSGIVFWGLEHPPHAALPLPTLGVTSTQHFIAQRERAGWHPITRVCAWLWDTWAEVFKRSGNPLGGKNCILGACSL